MVGSRLLLLGLVLGTCLTSLHGQQETAPKHRDRKQLLKTYKQLLSIAKLTHNQEHQRLYTELEQALDDPAVSLAEIKKDPLKAAMHEDRLHPENKNIGRKAPKRKDGKG